MNLNQEIKCLVWNPRSLNNKIETFIQYLEDNDIDIAAVSETWLASLNNYITGYLRERGYNIHHYHNIYYKLLQYQQLKKKSKIDLVVIAQDLMALPTLFQTTACHTG